MKRCCAGCFDVAGWVGEVRSRWRVSDVRSTAAWRRYGPVAVASLHRAVWEESGQGTRVVWIDCVMRPVGGASVAPSLATAG